MSTVTQTPSCSASKKSGVGWSFSPSLGLGSTDLKRGPVLCSSSEIGSEEQATNVDVLVLGEDVFELSQRDAPGRERGRKIKVREE